MKLSDFKQKPFSKKLSFVDGVMSVVEEKSALNGEVIFYELDADRINSIYEGVVKNNVEQITNDEFIFVLIPYICDIEVDVNKDEYKKMLDNPNADLLNLISLLMDSLKDVLSILDSFGSITNNIDDMKSKLGVEEETKEEKLERLYANLAITTNVDNIKVILSEIKKLEEND
jgi:hypothetical protein